MSDKEIREREKDRDLRETARDTRETTRDTREITRDTKETARDVNLIIRDVRDIKDVKNIKDAVTRNLIWIITTLVSIGVWIGTIMFQGKTIDAQGSLLANTTDRVMACEKIDIMLSGTDERIEGRLTGISIDIKELKESIRDMDTKNQIELDRKSVV